MDTSMIEVGDLSVGDTGFTVSCDRLQMMEELRKQACRYGADGVRIVRTYQPDFISTCIRFDAKLLKYATGKNEGSR